MHWSPQHTSWIGDARLPLRAEVDSIHIEAHSVPLQLSISAGLGRLRADLKITLRLEMSAFLGRAVWWLPVGYAFTDVFTTFHTISGSSMSPTLNPPGSSWDDIVLFERLSHR